MFTIGPIMTVWEPEAEAEADRSVTGPSPSFMPPQDPTRSIPEPIYDIPDPEGLSRAGTSRTTGTAKIIVLPVRFQDVDHSAANDRDGLLNKTVSSEPGALSMNNYYTEVSRGLFNLTGNVTDWVKSAYNMSWYGEDDDSGWPDSKNGPIFRLATESVLLADPFVDFSEFDEDGDGVVDSIFIVHSGQGQEAMGGTENDIWSHHWAVLDADLDEPGTQSLMVDGVKVFRYSMVSEYSPVGTWAHEYGHELGLPDLYDIDYSSWGIGRWGLMGAGSWNDGGNYPAHMCAWSKIELGWVTPVDVVGPVKDLMVEQVETGGNVYRLWIGDEDTSEEYFLIENRQKVGFDEKLPGHGILIWHIDDSQTSNTDDTHRLVDLEEADEANTGDNPVHNGDAWKENELGFGQFSIPNSYSYSGHFSGWTVKDIGVSGEVMNITIDVIADDVGVAFLLFPKYTAEGVPVYIDVHVFNYGLNDQKDIYVNITITQGTIVVDRDSRHIPSLVAKAARMVGFSFTPEVQGNYLITVRTVLEGDQVPENDEMADVLHTTEIIFYDDVESGENGWIHTSTLPPADIWKIVDDFGDPGYSKSPHHSWFCGVDQVGGGAYLPNTEYTLERTIDVALVKKGFLIFNHRHDLSFALQNKTIPRSDTAYVEIKTNMDPIYKTLDTFEGTSGGWNTRIYRITDHIESKLVINITIRFRLETQYLRFSKGWWVDDILITGQWLEHDVAILLDTDLTSIGPGKTKSVGVTIWNTGSDIDVYYLSVSAPPFWNTTLPKYEVVIEPLEHTSLTMTFKAPYEVNAGEEAEIRVHATSKGDSDVKRNATLNVIIERVYGLEVDPGPARAVRPGARETLVVSIANEGNGKESVHLNLSGSGAPWAELSVVLLDIEPYGTALVEIIIEVPWEVKVGDKAEVKVLASATSGVEDTGTVVMVFERVYGVMLQKVKDGQTVTPDSEVDLTFDIINLGNGKDTFDLTYVTPPGWKVSGDSRVVLGAWETVTLTITVTVFDDSPLSDFDIEVRADSINSKAWWSVELGVTVVLPDPAIVSLELSKTYLTKREKITVTVVVENKGTGNATDIIVGLFDNGDNFDTYMIDDLGSGERETIEVQWKFGNGHHDIAVVLGYEGAQADDTNDEAHESLKIKEPPAFIPGFGGVFCTMAVLAVAVIFIKRRR